MTKALSWSRPIVVADLPPDGIELELAPKEDVRAELARQAGVLAVPKLTANLKVTPDGRGGAEVAGTLDAIVRQSCVVTLDPFDNPVSELVEVRFSPASELGMTGGTIDVGLVEPPDPLVGGAIDLAALVAEFLTLGIDPYPRKPGAVFEPPTSGKDRGESAFAALNKLKRGPDKA